MTAITAFEVAPRADDAFLAWWERARPRGRGPAVLHRALRPDVAFRFVDVAPAATPRARHDALSDPRFAAHPGLYEVVRETGAPDTEGGVVLIEAFEVREEAGERFLAGWERARDVVAQQQGHLGARLHRSVGPADFRFIEVARWSSPLMVARARQRPAFAAAVEDLPYASHQALYQVVRGARAAVG